MNMKVDEWLSFFKQYNDKTLFSFSDFEVLTGESKKNLSIQLNRLVRSKVIKRPVRNWYENPFNIPSTEEISMILRPPAYLSMEYALYKHDIISQQIHVLTLVTTRLPYTYESRSQVFEYHQIKRSLFWGYQEHGLISLAEAEKAFLDLIYLRYSQNNMLQKQHLLSLLDSMYLEDLNKEKLGQYLQRYNQRTKDFIKEIKLV